MDYIPEKIIIVYRIEENNKYKEAFVVPEDNMKVLDTVIKWASSSYYNSTTNKTENYKFGQITIENKPCNVKIIDIDYRGNGGRAWKVIFNDKFKVDLRENVLLELITNKNINNGETENKLIWVRIGGNSKLIVYDSIKYKEILKTNLEKNKLKYLNNIDELQYYENRFGKEFLYLGLVSVNFRNVYCKILYFDKDYTTIEITKNPPKFVKKLDIEQKLTKQNIIDKIIEKTKIWEKKLWISKKEKEKLKEMKSLKMPEFTTF